MGVRICPVSLISMHGPWGCTDSGASESSSTMNSLARVCMYPCSHHAWEGESSQKDTSKHTSTHTHSQTHIQTVPWAYIYFLEPSRTITTQCIICSHPLDLLCHFKFPITNFSTLMHGAVHIHAHALQYWHEIKMDDTSLLIQKCFPVIYPNINLELHLCSRLYKVVGSLMLNPQKVSDPIFHNFGTLICRNTRTHTHTIKPLSLCSTSSPSLYLTFLSESYVHTTRLLLSYRRGVMYSCCICMKYTTRTHRHTHTVIHTSTKNLREFSISSSPFLSLSACGEHWQESGRREGLLGNGLWLPW